MIGYGIHTSVIYRVLWEQSLISVNTSGPIIWANRWTWAAGESDFNLMCPDIKGFPNLFEKTKESAEAFISTKLKHADIADTPIGSQRRKLLDLKVCKIIHQLSGEPIQQQIDYIQRSELSSSLFLILLHRCCAHPYHPHTLPPRLATRQLLLSLQG